MPTYRICRYNRASRSGETPNAMPGLYRMCR